MHLAGWAVSRLLSGTALAGVFVFALSRLPESAPTPAPEPPAIQKTDRLAATTTVMPKPVAKSVRTIPVYLPTDKPALPNVIGPSPFAVPPPASPPPVAPLAAPVPPPQVAPEVAPNARQDRATIEHERRRARPASLGPTRPGDRFTRFCQGRGRDHYSWMRINGKKRYCK